jgi:hypothetical protein
MAFSSHSVMLYKLCMTWSGERTGRERK